MRSTGGARRGSRRTGHEILLAGIPAGPGEELSRRLPSVRLREAGSLRDALAGMEAGDPVEAVVVDHELGGGGGMEFVRRLRESPRGRSVPVLYCATASLPVDSARELVGSLGVFALLFHPLDGDQLIGRIAEAIAGSVSGKRRTAEFTSALADARERFREGAPRRVEALEEAVAALRAGTLDEATRRRAEREAHTLAGSAGTLGFAEGARLARFVERLLEEGGALGAEDADALEESVSALRGELGEGPPEGGVAGEA